MLYLGRTSQICLIRGDILLNVSHLDSRCGKLFRKLCLEASLEAWALVASKNIVACKIDSSVIVWETAGSCLHNDPKVLFKCVLSFLFFFPNSIFLVSTPVFWWFTKSKTKFHIHHNSKFNNIYQFIKQKIESFSF